MAKALVFPAEHFSAGLLLTAGYHARGEVVDKHGVVVSPGSA